MLPVFAVIIITLVTSLRRLQQWKDCSSFQRNWDDDEAAHYYSITGLFREIGIGAALTKRPPFTLPLSCCRWDDDDEDGDHYDIDDGDDDDDSSNVNDDDPLFWDFWRWSPAVPGTWPTQEPCKPANLQSSPLTTLQIRLTSRYTLTRYKEINPYHGIKDTKIFDDSPLTQWWSRII